MPPEPLPWDRKDFFKERKHERSESLGSVARWRDSPHHAPRDFNRWASSDFRRPPGHGKQGGWHVFSDDSGHGYGSSRSGDKMVEDESFRSSFSRGDGRYGRNSRDNRGPPYSQRESKGYSWETRSGSPNMPGRPSRVNNEQRSQDDMLTYSSHQQSDFGSAWDQIQLKEQLDKMGGSTGLGAGQKCERENSLVSIDWKPLKWTRSGSMSSRGSGFSHSSSSKSMGPIDSNEAKVESQPKTATPVQSPSGEATNCVTSAAPLEETTSRKKPRLGWGEGLAKYEKKKVDVPDGSMNKDAAVCSVGNTEQAHSLSSSLPDKSPRVTAFSDCASPATPSSVACSSSPGVEEKSFCKAVNVENDTRNSCGSSGPMYQSHHEGFSFQLEKLDGNSIVNLDSSILELLQSDDPSSVDSSIPRPTALNKLLIWKGEISKVLEVTESEIDSLENELKALKSDSGGSCPRPATSSSLPVEEKDKSCKEQVTNLTTRLSPLQIHSSGDTDLQKMCVDNGDQVEFCGIVKDEDIDSPGTATSKFVESLPLVSSDMTNKTGGSEDRDPIQTTKGEETCLVPSRYAEKTDPSTCGNSSMLLDSEVVALDSGVVDKLCDPIFSANKIFASRASDIFSKLLPKEHISGVSVSSSWKNDSLIKEKFAKRKRRLRFMERVITLKFKAFQHLWKEDMSVLSMRKYRPKSHKKFELSLRATNNGHQKHRSSIRSRFSTPAGSLSVVPTTEIINFTNKLLSDSQVKPYRNSLKMPALILDKEEKLATRFVSSNGLVEDPCAVEKERALMNPWTPEEKELFIQKLTTYGKDFRKIASFLDHKTTADCVEFYYKHHKSDCFVKTKKKPDMAKQGKSSANTYLISDGKKWNREMDAASLDILGAASAIAAHADGGTRNRQTYSRRLILGGYRNTNTSRGEDTTVERSCSLDTIGNERETAAADVLAGICGSMSSEAVSSCITSSIDPGESYLEWKCQKGDSVVRRPLTPDVMQNVDDETCSDESCGEMDPSDWTDEEKSRFIQAVSSYGKDFDMISRCIRSRSQQQCKVFFSKARKCLGLDLVHPGPGNGTSVGDDANGGGSDAEDACVLETGSGISSDKSGCNMNEDVPLSVTNMNDDEADPAETMKLQTSPPRPEENNVIGEVDHGDGKPLKSLASDAFQAVDKPKLVFDGDTGIMESNAMGGNATENKILVAESRPVGEGINSDPPNPECMVGEKLVGQISSDRFGKKLEGGDERSNRDPSGCCLPASAHNSCGNTSDVAADGSCSAPGLNPECPHQVSVELNSVQKPSVISLPHENAPATAVSVPQDSAVIECEKSLSQDRMSSTLDLREGSVGRDESRKHLSGLPVHANVEASQVLRGYPLQMVPKKETNGDVSCGNLSEVKPDRNINGHYMTQDGFLHFGNSKPQCSQVDCPPVPLKVEQPGDARTAHSWSSSDSEKPSRNGDVKLFGKILSNPSSSSKPNGSIHENEEEGAHNQKFSNKSSNLNLTGHHSADGSSPLLKFDCSSYLGLENVPSRSYGGFWEGNKVQAGYSSFSDSAILLAKYPAAFSNFPTSSSQMEQQPPQAVLKTSDRSMNGISVFRGEEINGSNGVADYPVFSRGQDGGNKVQPFTVDVKQQQQQRQDVFDIPKRNGFDAISSIQQQGRGSVGMNVVGRGGILVGGPCTVSDPVAAIRMHYAKTEQYGGQAGSIFRKEESWRGGKGDIGR